MQNQVNSRISAKMTLLIVSIIVLFVANLLLGTVSIPFENVCKILLGNRQESEIWYNIIWSSRVPQSLTALVAGAALAVSGLQMQTVFRNPLAGPSVLGISNGAALGVAFVVLLSGSLGGVTLSKLGYIGDAAISIAAIVGSLAVMSLIVFVSQRVKGNVTLLIIGVMIGYIANAVIGVLKFFSAEEDIKAYVVWGLGTFSRVSGDQMVLFCVIAGSGILVAVVTAYCGPIMFIGLAVPHLARALFRTSDHRILMPSTLFLGGLLALVCNLIARMPGFEGALPVNSVTALVGAPVIASVLFKRRKDEIQE